MQQQQPRVRLGRVYDEHTAEDGTQELVEHLRHLREQANTLLAATRQPETSEAAVLTDLFVEGRAA
jgi:uncharacterized protein YeaO (DUF488 family)